MRRNAISSAAREEESEINLTPMLDVVFIMLIFFIVTANFIKECLLYSMSSFLICRRICILRRLKTLWSQLYQLKNP